MSRGPFEWNHQRGRTHAAGPTAGPALTHNVPAWCRAAWSGGWWPRWRSATRPARRSTACTGGSTPWPRGPSRHSRTISRTCRALSGGRRRKLDDALSRLTARGVPPAIADALGEYLGAASDQAVARIRPLNLAARFGLDPAQFVDACLVAGARGLARSDVGTCCARCAASRRRSTTRSKRSRDHDRCEACNLDFQLDFANSVEMIFRVHPEIRASELGTYCIGGPAHSPHVAAQVRIAPGEALEAAAVT